MSKSILCAVDLGHPEIGKKILSEAEKMAHADSATINVVTVVPDYGMTIVGSYFEDGVMDKAIASSNKALHSFAKENLSADVTLRHIIAQGSVYEEVLKTAEKVKADLIVIGASRPDFKDYLLGPNAARVARHADVSVYIVRE